MQCDTDICYSRKRTRMFHIRGTVKVSRFTYIHVIVRHFIFVYHITIPCFAILQCFIFIFRSLYIFCGCIVSWQWRHLVAVSYNIDASINIVWDFFIDPRWVSRNLLIFQLMVSCVWVRDVWQRWPCWRCRRSWWWRIRGWGKILLMLGQGLLRGTTFKMFPVKCQNIHRPHGLSAVCMKESLWINNNLLITKNLAKHISIILKYIPLTYQNYNYDQYECQRTNRRPSDIYDGDYKQTVVIDMFV